VHCPEEVLYIGPEWVFFVFVEIGVFVVLDFVQVFGSGELGVIGWDKAGFKPDASFLKIFAIEFEIVLAQGADPDDLHIALDDVDEHGQFIEPEFAEETAQGCDSEIVPEFSSFIQAVVVIHISLHIFGIGMHGSEFVNIKLLSVFSDSSQSYNRTISRMVIIKRSPDFPGFPVQEVSYVFLLQNLKPATIESAQCFGAGDHPVLSACDKEIDLISEFDFGNNPLYEKVDGIDYIVQNRRVFMQDPLLAKGIGFAAAQKDTTFGQLFIYTLKKFVDSLDIVDPFEVDDRCKISVRLVFNIEAGGCSKQQGPGIADV